MERLAVTIQTAAAGAFCGMMAIDMSFDLPVLNSGTAEDLNRAHQYYAWLRGASHMPMVVTGVMAATGISMFVAMYYRITWRRILSLLSLAAAAPFFVMLVEPSEDALLSGGLPRDLLRGHLTTVARGHFLLLTVCAFNIFLLATEKPVTIVRKKIN